MGPRPCGVAPGCRPGVAQRGVASDDRGGRRQGRPPNPLSRVEHAGGRQRAEWAAGGGRPHRGAEALVSRCVPSGTDSHRRRVPHHRRRGDARRAGLVHAGGAVGPALVVAGHRLGGGRCGERRPAPAGPARGSQAVAGLGGAPQPERWAPRGRLGADRGLLPDRPQLAAAARRRCRRLGVGRHGGPDRPGHARTATGRAGGGRGRCGADSRQRRRGPRGRGRCAQHGHGNVGRPLLRRLGGGRSASDQPAG